MREAFKQWLNAMIIAFLIVFVGNTIILADEIVTSCYPQEGVVKVGIRVNEMLSTYQWSTNKLTLIQEKNLQESPVQFPTPFKQYGGDIEKWNIYYPGVDQNMISQESRLDAPFDLSSDETWFVSGLYPAHGDLNYSATNRFAIIYRPERRVFKIMDLSYPVKALTWAPSGKAIAFLLTENVTGDMPWSFSRWFAEKIGHHISYYNLSVAFYDRNGNEICNHQFRERAAYGGGYLEWHSEFPNKP